MQDHFVDGSNNVTVTGSNTATCPAGGNTSSHLPRRTRAKLSSATSAISLSTHGALPKLGGIMPLQDSVAWYREAFSDAEVGEKVAGIARSGVADFARQLAISALQISALWALNFAGVWLVKRMVLPIPGNLVGMITLYALLALGIVKLAWFETAGSFLIRHLAFFFCTDHGRANECRISARGARPCNPPHSRGERRGRHSLGRMGVASASS